MAEAARCGSIPGVVKPLNNGGVGAEFERALANDEFELYFQPLVNLKSGRISTCEALLRWNHPVRGTVSPVDIIPVAEDMGLIVDLGRWILRKACMECMKWPDAVSVAVNFSPQQFHQRDVLSEVRYALEVSGLPAHRLEIEKIGRAHV